MQLIVTSEALYYKRDGECIDYEDAPSAIVYDVVFIRQSPGRTVTYLYTQKSYCASACWLFRSWAAAICSAGIDWLFQDAGHNTSRNTGAADMAEQVQRRALFGRLCYRLFAV